MSLSRSKHVYWIVFLCAAIVVAMCTIFGRAAGPDAPIERSGAAASSNGNTFSATPAAKIKKTATEFENTWKPLTGPSKDRWLQTFEATPPTLSSAGSITPGTAQAYSNGKQILVRAGVEGKDLVEPSGVSALYDEGTGRTSSTVETVFVQANGGGFVKTWIDGKDVLNTFVPTPKDSDKTRTIGWDEFTSCLNNAGVASWVITAITIACSAICLGTAGAGCVPCITAAAGVTGGVFYSCAAQALFYS